jgi:hypothetical protein
MQGSKWILEWVDEAQAVPTDFSDDNQQLAKQTWRQCKKLRQSAKAVCSPRDEHTCIRFRRRSCRLAL